MKRAARAAARTQNELAQVHGITQQAISKWIADPRWAEAGFSKKGPWSVKEIARQKVWREEVLQEDRAAEAMPAGATGGGDLNRAKTIALIKKAVAQEQKLQTEIAILRKAWIKREEAEENEAAKWRTVKEAFMQLPKNLRQSLGDADAPGCEAILEKAFRAVFAAFSQDV